MSASTPNWEQLRKQAKDLLHAARAHDANALSRLRAVFPAATASDAALNQCQLALARENGFPSWATMKRHVEATPARMPDRPFQRDLPYFEGRAEGLHSVVQSGLPAAIEQARAFHPRFADPSVPIAEFSLDDARTVVARQHGCETWTAMEAFVAALASGERQEPFLDAFDALKAHDAPRLRSLITQYPDIVNARGTNGNTLLGLAVSLETTADLSQPPGVAGDAGGHPSKCLDILLAAGADVHAANDRGWTALHQAAYSNNVRQIDRLLSAGAKVDACAHGDGGTPLMMALFWGHCAAAERLAHVEVTPRNLRAAAGLGDVAMLKELIGEDGALAPGAGAHRAFYRPHSGFPVWHPSRDAAEIRNEALVYAAKSGRVEAIALLLDRGAEVNAEPYNGTALHWAASQGQVDALRLLLERGATVDRVSSYGGVKGITPLHAAAWGGKMETVKALMDAGADFTRRDPEHHGFPWGWAAYGGHKKVSNYILERGSHTDIFHAAAVNRPDRVAALLDADPSLLNHSDGHTRPLIYAAQEGSTEVVRLLLERGADPHATDRRKRTARVAALEDNHAGIAALLPE